MSRAQARAALEPYLSRLSQPPPCRVLDGLAWIAEDPGEQSVAARACQTCPALDPCRTYGLAHPREYGVYGAMTTGQRRSHHATQKRLRRTA